jgi:hypothetical protein
MTKSQDNADTRDFKSAAKRLQGTLQTHGIRLKEGIALEALSTSLGLANWRTLRAKLNPEPANSLEVDYGVEGYASNRLNNEKNELERAFAKAWKEEQSSEQGKPLLPLLVPGCSTEQAKAAATVVQWLGTEVGQFFLEKVMSLHDQNRPREWVVHGVYQDNNQRWSDTFVGRTPLEAQVWAQVDRLADGGSITRIDVAAVTSKRTGEVADVESFLHDVDLEPMQKVLAKVTELARKAMPKPPTRGVLEADEWDFQNAEVELWEALAKDRYFGTEMDNILVGDSSPLSEEEWEYVDFKDSRGVDYSFSTVEALKDTVIPLAKSRLDLDDMHSAKATGLFQVYQLEAVLHYFEKKLKHTADEAVSDFD